jgi:hypothetical protein
MSFKSLKNGDLINISHISLITYDYVGSGIKAVQAYMTNGDIYRVGNFVTEKEAREFINEFIK